MMKQLGKIWSNLTKDERKVYEDVARKDKERYESEMKIITSNGRTVEKVHEVEHKRPKKCLSAYMIFVRERRCKISAANPDMPVLQIMKEVGNEWQNLTPDQRQIYQAMADEDKIRYKEELKEFEKEVEKLQIVKVAKPKANSKNKKKTSEIKNDAKSDSEEQPKIKSKTGSPEIIEIEDIPHPVKKIEEDGLSKSTKEDYQEDF